MSLRVGLSPPRASPAIRTAYVGVDVSVSRRKRIPISVCVRDEAGRLSPLALKGSKKVKAPPGIGNAATLCDNRVAEFAQEMADFLKALVGQEKLEIRRIAIDAPRDYRSADSGRRASEQALYKEGIPYFSTPSEAEFAEIRKKAEKHLRNKGSQSRLPHANQLWMLAGFQIWRKLIATFAESECLETHPHAISVRLKAESSKKSSSAGFTDRLNAVYSLTGWDSPDVLKRRIDKQGYGSSHDKLDAFLCAWLASLDEGKREALGKPSDDAIWVPVGSRR